MQRPCDLTGNVTRRKVAWRWEYGYSIGHLSHVTDDKENHTMDEKTRIELEAAAFRTLVAHLRERTDVQNIDLMNLADFCRNCLAKWYRAAAQERGLALDYEEARTLIYGMSYSEWKDKYQLPATSEPLGDQAGQGGSRPT